MVLKVIAGVVLGAFVILIPGFIITLAIYPRKDDLDFWKRIAVSLGLGLLLLIYILVVLALPQFKLLRLGPFVVSLLVFCSACALVAYKRGGAEVVIHYRHTTLEEVRKIRHASKRFTLKLKESIKLVRKIKYISKPRFFKRGKMRRTFKFKQVIVVRTNLEMSPGKLAVQVAHGSIAAAERARKERRDWLEAWLMEGQKKAVVKVPSEAELGELCDNARKLGVPAELVQDAGLTELPPGTTTVLAVGPAPFELVDKITGRLPLL